MTVRCVQCGQENNPQYRFCGVCGAPLGPPPPAAPPEVGRQRVRVPVSGPSFLGLGDERSRDLDYLLEDEPPRGRARLYLALLLLVASGALLARHWQRDGYPWSGILLKPTASSPAPSSSPSSPVPAPAPAPESAAAAAPIPIQPTANPAPPAQPASSEGVPPPSPATGTAASAAADNPAAAAKPADQTSQPIAAKPSEEAAQPIDNSDSSEAAAKTPAAVSPPTGSQATNSQATSEPETAAPPRREKRTASVLPGSKSVSPKPSPAAPADAFEDRLVADGEKYLYGRGAPQDCERAQRNLQIGARQSNARAQTLLGAMYATGHCVNRDLPTAYRWFAKALHGDPGNSRVQRDLEVLWKQMTPEERQLTMKSQ